MSMRCEDVRPLLAELVYDEIDPAVADELRDHLGECLSCRRHQKAFSAVRFDLQEWQPADNTVPNGMTFIAPGAHTVTPIWHSRLFQGLATAAGFMFLAVFTAAATNLQVQSGPEGWAVSTSFGESAAFDAEPPTVALQQINGLNDWFDERLGDQIGNQLDSRGVVTLASLPQPQFLTAGQVQDMTQRVSNLLDESFTERDLRLDSELENLRFYVDSNVEEQSNRFFYSVSNMYEEIEADHRDSLFQINETLGYMSADFGRRLDQADSRIDNLGNLVALNAPQRSPEQ